MSGLKFVQDEFIESIELNRFKKFLTTYGSYADLINNSEKFGIVKNDKLDSAFTNFRIVQGTTSGTIKILNGIAYTKNRDRILFKETDNIAVPIDGIKYFLKIGYTTSPIEDGTVSISTSGYLTGVGTKFTEILRGQPNFPSLIEFVDAASNLLQYEVLRVIDDTNAQLQGVYTVSETNLRFKVVGTFTPGIYPSVENQFIFQYDSCILTLIPQSSLPTNIYYPQLLDDQEFIIGNVSNTAGIISINDSRYDFLWRTRAERTAAEIPRFNNAGYQSVENNPLISVTSIKKLVVKDQNYYQISFDWKFTITAKTIDRVNNIIKITAGSGGKYDSILDFVDGSFNGWRLYHNHSGEFSTILSSTLVSTLYIQLTLDYIPQRIGSLQTELNDSLTNVCPNAEAIEISVEIPLNNTATLPLTIERKLFQINSLNPQMLISENRLYKVEYITLPISYQYKSLLNQTNY